MKGYILVCNSRLYGSFSNRCQYSKSGFLVDFTERPDLVVVAGPGMVGGALSSACFGATPNWSFCGRSGGRVAGLTATFSPETCGGASPAGGGAVPAAGGGSPRGLRPLRGRSATCASLSMAAGWQFSQWCSSNFGVKSAFVPTLTLIVDLDGRSTIGNGPIFIGPKGLGFPFLI